MLMKAAYYMYRTHLHSTATTSLSKGEMSREKEKKSNMTPLKCIITINNLITNKGATRFVFSFTAIVCLSIQTLFEISEIIRCL